MTVDEFFIRRAIDPSRASVQQKLAADLLLRCDLSSAELWVLHRSRLQNDPTWGLCAGALRRIQEYAEASIAASVTSLTGGEIIARTVVEAAANLRFVLKDRSARILSYFSDYINVETRQCELWTAALREVEEEDVRQFHIHSISQKQSALEAYRMVISSAEAELGTQIPRWGSLLDRFKNVEGELGYRTTYSALCSQVHNDAEDLLNEFIIKSMGDDEMVAKLKEETDAFAWFAVTLGIQYYCRALVDYWRTFELLPSGSAIAEKMTSVADKLASDAMVALTSVHA